MRKYLSGLTLGLLSLSCTACLNADDYEQHDPGLVHLLTTSGSAAANGAEAVTVVAEISHDAAIGRRGVVFKTDLGSFKGGKGDSVVADAGDDYKAEVQIVSTKAGTATVTTKARGVQAKEMASVVFVKAYPTVIEVSVDSATVSNQFAREITITATLKSGNGKTSQGHEVEFDVQDAANNPVGIFVNNNKASVTDANGTSRIRFSPGGVSPGLLKVIAKTKDAAGAYLPEATTRIYVYQR